VDAVELNQEITWIEKALQDPESVEHKIYLSNAPRKDLITRWADNLEKLKEAGQWNHDLTFVSTHISNKFREWKMEGAIHYVRHVLDFKYKVITNNSNSDDDELNGYDNRQDSSELISFEATQSNQTLIQFMINTIDALKSNIERLKKDVFIESKIPDNIADQIFLNWAHVLKRHQEAWDGREKVLSSTQHLMAYALSQYSLNHAYVEYIKYAKDDTKLTEKQASKMARLQTNKVDELFNPQNFAEAKELGFRGQQCGKCGSWRTESKYNPEAQSNQLFCYAIHEDKTKDQWESLKTMKMEEVIIG